MTFFEQDLSYKYSTKKYAIQFEMLLVSLVMEPQSISEIYILV